MPEQEIEIEGRRSERKKNERGNRKGEGNVKGEKWMEARKKWMEASKGKKLKRDIENFFLSMMLGDASRRCRHAFSLYIYTHIQ